MAPMGDDSDYESDDNGENEEDERMKQLLASWDDDNSNDSSDSSEDEEDEEEEDAKPAGATKFDLGLEDNVLDHIVIAAPDFQEALKEFENMTGIKVSSNRWQDQISDTELPQVFFPRADSDGVILVVSA